MFVESLSSVSVVKTVCVLHVCILQWRICQITSTNINVSNMFRRSQRTRSVKSVTDYDDIAAANQGAVSKASRSGNTGKKSVQTKKVVSNQDSSVQKANSTKKESNQDNVSQNCCKCLLVNHQIVTKA